MPSNGPIIIIITPPPPGRDAMTESELAVAATDNSYNVAREVIDEAEQNGARIRVVR